MAEVKILQIGYSSADYPDEERTSPTITLVKDQDLVMVIDPGVLAEKQLLITSLEEIGLKVDDVNLVAITHSHPDHYRNLGLFPKAKLLEYYGIWDGDKVEDWSEQFTPNIRIIKTPGHSSDSLTFLVKTKQGIIAICGDVFWKENYPANDPYANNSKALQVNRQKLLTLADWIIPGHGPIFSTKK